MTTFKAEDKKIEEVLFGHEKYRVPPFQRPYSWTTDEAEDFWEDLISPSSSAFIGSFVLNFEHASKDGYIEIVDGQQRLLTITIFLAALRDASLNEKEKDIAERIQRMSIAIENTRGEYEYRIVGGDSIKNFFIKFIQNPETAGKIFKDPSDEEKLIINNYNYFKNLINAELARTGNKKAKHDIVHDLWEKIFEIRVIRILLENEDDAYAVFETVNARGADLTVADLLKNHIFKHVRERGGNIEDAAVKWNQICTNIEETGSELSRFIRQYWLSRYGYVGEKNLYREIKRNISEYSIFLDDLVDASDWFNKLIVGEKSTWKDLEGINGVKIFKSLLGVRAMGVSQCYVLFLSLLRNRKNIAFDTSNSFLLIENFTFVYSALGKQQANRVEKIYSKIAVALDKEAFMPNEKLRTKNIQRILSQLKDELHSIWPKDTFSKEGFNDLSLKRSEKSRVFMKYILSRIDEYQSKREFDLDFDVVSIEHILPQNPGPSWNLSKAEIRSYVNKLGNLALVHKDYNSAAGNKELSEKIKYLEKTSIPSTKKLVEKISERGRWGETEIDSRQESLKNFALKEVWIK